MKSGFAARLAPLAILWLAAHALLLGLILGVKFLTAKTVALFLLLSLALMLVLNTVRGPVPRRIARG